MPSVGERISVYVRPADLWVLDAIDKFREVARTEFGVNLKKSDVVVQALTVLLNEHRHAPLASPLVKVAADVRLKRSIRCPQDYAWVFERVEDIVKIKRELGLPASFAQELIHLAQNSLIADTPYGIMVRKMLDSAQAQD